MRKLLVASVLSAVLFAGCISEAVINAHPKGQFVVHRLSKRRGQVIGYGLDDMIRVRFVSRPAVDGPNGTVLGQEVFEDVYVQPFEIEPAD